MLTEQKVLRSVELVVDAGTAHAKWVNQILRDGDVISEVPHRETYTKERKDRFLSEVPNAGSYITALGW